MLKKLCFLFLAIAIVGVPITLRSMQPDDDYDRTAAQSSASRLVVQRQSPAFDLRDANIPRSQIRSGGPPKDGIPALSNPKFLQANEVDYLDPTDRIIGVTIDSTARAYPLRVLNLHEIVNDRIGKVPFMVTYCPLCDSAVVFDRRTPIGEREFGVSGLLYNSNVLMYDRGGEPESLWSQVLGAGVSGPAAGLKLKALPMELTTWQDWKSSHPETQVLAGNYQRNPYAAYFNTPKLMFPAQPLDRRLPAKTPVLGVWTKDGQSRAYPVTHDGATEGIIRDLLSGAEIVIRIDRKSNSIVVVEADPSLQWMNSFWFAWYAMHPKTELFGDE